ncbi:hypothetical protein P353_09400 [Comamonas testosteroni]|uniref:Uncharacterized protein n=1 Tax=Comamonas testosteroni TaxID=285 RepID=A0A096HP59_COMTE|nr:hypothetical protein P353_09400 [Comamonas testosteroni]
MLTNGFASDHAWIIVGQLGYVSCLVRDGIGQ